MKAKAVRKTVRFTCKVAAGLSAIRSLASVELDAGDHGAFHPEQGFPDGTAEHVERAIAWLDYQIAARQSVKGRKQ